MKLLDKLIAQATDKKPELLLGFGAVAIIGGIVCFCKSTLKAQDDILDYKEKIEDLKLKHIEDQTMDEQENEGKNLPEIDHAYKKELTSLYLKMGFKCAGDYALATALTSLGFVLIFKSNSVQSERIAQLSVANTGLQAALDTLHKNIKEEYGEEADRRLTYGIKKAEIETTDENGKKIKKEVDICDPDRVASPFARWFKQGVPGWENNNTLNLSFLIAQEEYANIKLEAQGYLYLNDVYKALGFNEDPVMGWRAGWIRNDDDPADSECRVNFRIFDSLFKPNQDFVNGYTNEVLLDFNCQSDIWKELYMKGHGSGNKYRDEFDYPNGI